MQNISRFLWAAVALALNACILVSLGLGIYVLTFIFAGLSTIACGICAYLTFRDNSKLNHKVNMDQNISPNKKHRESISHAVEQTPSSNFDESANKESATTVSGDLDPSHRDDESGLLSASFFPVYLEQRITSARRTLRPVSLVVFELDGLDRNDSGAKSDRDFYITAVGDVVKRTLRESDCAFRIDDNIFAAVMDDTTESGAVWAAERVRGVLHTGALAGRVTVSAGVACYPSHVLEPEELIASANKALGIAKSRGVDQVEIAAEQ